MRRDISYHSAQDLLRSCTFSSPSTSLKEVSPETYLEKMDIDIYIRDVLSSLVRRQPPDPLVYVKSYFNSVASGKHVLGREYEYVNATTRNRLAYLTHIQALINQMGELYKLKCNDLFQLVCAYCSDFPFRVVSRTFEVFEVQGSDSNTSIISSFNNIRKFQMFSVCWFYHDFFTLMQQLYHKASALASPSSDAQPSGQDRDDPADNTTSAKPPRTRGNATRSQHIVLELKTMYNKSENRQDITLPPLSIVEAVIYNSPNFREFCASCLVNADLIDRVQCLQIAITKTRLTKLA